MKFASPRPSVPGLRALASTLFCRLIWAGVVAVMVTLGGCGDVGDACLFDSDCGGGNLCVREQCLAVCSVESDCEPPYDRCLAVTRERSADKETVKICVDEAFVTDDDNPTGDCKATGDCCTSDEECIELYDDSNAHCARDGRCLIPLS